MTRKKDQPSWQHVWERARKQHGVIARRQLIGLEFRKGAIEWGLDSGTLHRTEWRGVYAVGRPDLGPLGRLRGALLSRGDAAVLVDDSAAGLWEIRRYRGREIFIAVPASGQRRKRRGVTVHRRILPRGDITWHYGIPVTTPARTIIDMAAKLNDEGAIERMIDQADARNVLKVPALRDAVHNAGGERGAPLVRRILEEDAFVLTDSELERLMVPIARAAGLGRLESQVYVNGWRVDFYCPDLPLVIECNSLRYHRTPFQQRRDHERDQAHAAAGTPRARFTHHQIAHRPRYVEENLRRTAERIRRPARTPGRPRARGRT